MPMKLTTTIRKVQTIPNPMNIGIVNDFLDYMRKNGSSEHHQNNNLKVVIAFANFLGKESSFYDIKRREQVFAFLDTKIKSNEEDPDKKWITTWNNYLNRIKLFYRWLFNNTNEMEFENWQTPEFVKIKTKKSKRISPYLESEIWEKDELLSIIKYEPHMRNKAALTLFWDLNGRNHEITMLRLKHIRIKENYAEGEVPHEAKTGSGPILLTMSFPYVRDWINTHPFRNSPDAHLVCNIMTGAPIKPESMWTMMDQLKKRILKMLEQEVIKDPNERQKLQYFIRTKKWNPYCLRHSSISNDSDFLPEYALKKKVRWSMNSKQGARYIKRRMGNDLKQKILEHNGIISGKELKRSPTILNCGRCGLINGIDNKYCSNCYYPLSQSVYEEIKIAEEKKVNEIVVKYESEMKHFREEVDEKINSILSTFHNYPQLTQIKASVLKKKLKMQT